MRIAVIGSFHTKAGFGGTQSVLSELCPRLTARGHDIDVYVERNGTLVPSAECLPIIRVPNWSQRLADRVTGARSAEAKIWCGYDVAHLCADDASALGILGRLPLPKTVVTVLGPEVGAPPPRKRFAIPFWSRRGESAAARWADRITVASRSLERRFRENYGRAAIYIPGGVSLKYRPDPLPLAHLGIAPGSYVLAGGCDHPREMSELISSFLSIPTEKRLVVMNAGLRFDFREALATGRVTVLPRQDGAAREALLGHAYLFVQSAKRAGASRWVRDAIAHSRAVLVSDTAENMEIVGGDGFTFTSGDGQDLKRMLGWLLTDDDVVRRMQSRTAVSAVTRLGWDLVAARYERVLQSVV
jgi:glycosyltransferase involved in cell wall biosynthesis